MTKDSAKSLHKGIVAVVVVAGLLTGAVITYYATKPPAALESDTAPPMVPEHRVPYDKLHAEQQSPPAKAEAGHPPTASEDTPSAGRTDERQRTEATDEPEITENDRWAIVGARNRAKQQGVEEYVELDDELYVAIGAELVIAASRLQEREDAKELLVDYTAQVLGDEHVDPDEYYTYTRRVADSPEKAQAMAERILQEAEKRANTEISVEGLTALQSAETAAPLAQGE